MPEAPTNLDRDLGGAKHDVGGPSQLGDGASADPVTKPQCVEGAAQLDFGLRVPASVGEHRSAGGGARSPALGHTV